MLITVTIMGAALAVTEQVSRGYTTQLDGALIQDEARFALEWVETQLRTAGSNPYDIATTNCPSGVAFEALRLDPNGNGVMVDVRLQADVNPPNGLLGGVGGVCDETGEDVTIAHDPTARTITLLDNNVGGNPTPMTDSVITSLRFTYLDASRAPTTVAATAAFVQIGVTATTPNANRAGGASDSVTLTSEVLVRTR
jgi:Tfp pilus assembly protein PilW